ncbi:hypothetical protein ABB37_04368 [Leptomonas pyrrhocoris]|uniref:Schlafen AlbA-2 domain-containing protein n=1 Tax=Leptomonas pyrrhocoris TaxID=157538 RepID=A0A0N0DW32_LEPPY|nr:hypothetical protein ABB37_04368 [Leptomonas pyrrhocoris]KPA80981.1 hypothetical protein ABB37_04368 [Leptomonas pyrrhocoris]|eukprot:XP_015659420.1 hypothetical protein ABB37_04368 [Leptomonas pyrrhocoris]
MQVDLSAFFSAHEVLVDSNGAEVAVARAFAAAANTTHRAHRHATAPEYVAVALTVHSKEACWSRRLKDVVLRCVDRATGRVYPPLDVLQYISNDSPAFVSGDEGTAEGAVRVVFSVRPSAAFVSSPQRKQHAVEGEVMQGVELPELEDAAAVTAAASEVIQNTISDMDLWYRARAAHQQYDSSIPLESIHQLAGSLLDVDGGGEEGSGGGTQDAALLQARQKQQEEKLEQLQWQLARWLTELFLNEGGWARAQGPSASVTTSLTKQKNSDAAARRLFHGPLRLAFPHVVDAALFSGPIARQQSSLTAELPAGAETVPRRQLHTDVRGMEWDGLLIGYTTRYAYIAVPYFVSAAETTVKATASVSCATEPACVWSIVSRLPIPAFARREASRRMSEDGAEEANGVPRTKKQYGAQRPSKETRKRTHTDADAEASTAASFPDRASSRRSDATVAQTVLSRCFNVEEAMRHDTNAAAAFRLTDVPYIVTVRAHRVYCARADVTKQLPLPPSNAQTTSLCTKKPHPAASPYRLSMILEDAYVVAHRPAGNSADTSVSGADGSLPPPSATHWAAALFGVGAGRESCAATASSLARSLHTFPDVVSVVRESCHRFVRSHERFCATYTRCLEVKRLQVAQQSPTPQQPPSATTHGGSKDKAPSPQESADEAARGLEQTEQSELPSPAVAAQQLRLLRRAEDVYASIADSMSVHYKKLRGASRVAIPSVHTSADVPALEESNNVEFKAKVGLTQSSAEAFSSSSFYPCVGGGRGRGRQASTMDTERLRNTIAAMAACRGGLILIGVADDGHIVGHAKQLEVGKHLRTSGFCPAMVKDAVQVKELRWLEKAREDATAVLDAPAKRAMPENWWKTHGANSTAGSDASSSLNKAERAAADRVITVISVEKGQAPFYATSKNTPPYQRGCASTVVMPTVVLARRLMKELA